MSLIPLTFQRILQSRNYTLILLGTDEKKFGIYTEPRVGAELQGLIAIKAVHRPPTSLLLSKILTGLETKVIQVVINDVQDTVFFSRLFLEVKRSDVTEIIEIDARPSDSICLAMINGAPLYCTKEFIEKVTPIDAL